jgi:hypothetical protein
MRKYFGGWMTVTCTYFLTLYAAFALYGLVFQLPPDHRRSLSGPFIGTFMVIVPYMLAGLYVSLNSSRPLRDAFWISLVPAISEKLGIYLIGAVFVAGGGDGGGDGIVKIRNVMMFAGAEALPYYTYTYLSLGTIVSVCACMITAKLCKARRIQSTV